MVYSGQVRWTTDGHEWQKHRRIVTSALGEKISPLVWQEASRQAQEMMDSYMELPKGETDQTILGLRRIAVNVLASSGYGRLFELGRR